MVNDYLNDVEKYKIENSLLNIIYIHNNKVHSTTKRIPKDIKDLTDRVEIDLIKDYVFDVNNITVKDNFILEKN